MATGAQIKLAVDGIRRTSSFLLYMRLKRSEPTLQGFRDRQSGRLAYRLEGLLGFGVQSHCPGGHSVSAMYYRSYYRLREPDKRPLLNPALPAVIGQSDMFVQRVPTHAQRDVAGH